MDIPEGVKIKVKAKIIEVKGKGMGGARIFHI